MTCVVCRRLIADGSDRYANAWEAVRRKLPCCSDACSSAFDPEVHWLPPRPPTPAPPSEQQRLLSLAAERLRASDEPVLVRELLLSGVSPDGLKRVLEEVRPLAPVELALAQVRRWELMTR